MMNERIRELRHYLDLTQQEFADRLGIKRNTIANYEIGRNEPVDSVLSLICREFNVREEWLRNGTGEMFQPDPESELDALCDRYDLSDRSRAFIKSFAELREEEQDVILKYIEKVADAIREKPAAVPDPVDLCPDDVDLHADLQRELDLQKKHMDGSTGSSSSAV